MNIVYFLAETWPTHRADVAVLFGKYLPRFNIHSTIVTLCEADRSSASMPAWNGGDSILSPSPASRLRQIAWKFLHNIKVLMTLRNMPCDVIQVRDMPVTGALAIIAAGFYRKPIYYWMSYAISESEIALAHDRGWKQGLNFLMPMLRGHLGKWLLYHFVLPKCHHIFVQSYQMLEDVSVHGIPHHKMTAVPMGIDMETVLYHEITPIDDPLLAGKQVLVYLGTLHRSRRIEMLLEMIGHVVRECPDALLVIVGDIDEAAHRDWLHARAVDLGVEKHVLWTGWLPMLTAWRYVKAAQVALSPFPRSFELDSCSPTKVIEYLALEIPVIANDQPEQEMVIRDSGGGICVEWSPEAFARAAVVLLGQPERRKEMGERGKQYVVSTRTYDSIAERVSIYYRQVTGVS